MGPSPCIWHTELGCISFPRIIRLQMISSRDVYKIVGDATLHRQTGLCRVSQPICLSIAVTLLVRPKLLQVYLAYWRCTISSDATGAAEVVAGVSGIPALHHLQLVYVPWHTGVAPSPACICSYTISRHTQGRSRCFCKHLFCSFLCHLDAGSRLFCFSSRMSFFMLKIVLVPTPSTFLRRSVFSCISVACRFFFCGRKMY